MLNIFCPYRNRASVCKDFIAHYRQYFPESKIYILEQADTSPFKRGQLMNVAFNNLFVHDSPVQNALFVDVDIRLKYPIDFEGLLQQYNTVVIPFNKLSLYNFVKIGEYQALDVASYFLDTPDGGVTLFTTDIFRKCNGFSNLYVGWGREDSDFVRRNTVTRLANEMIHLEHKRNNEWNSYAFKKNDQNFKFNPTPSCDGFEQTTGEYTLTELQLNVYLCKIKNIGTIAAYKYKDRL